MGVRPVWVTQSLLISSLRSRMRVYVTKKNHKKLQKERNHDNIYSYMNIFQNVLHRKP